MTLLTLVPLLALVLLTAATVVLELAAARESHARGSSTPRLLVSTRAAFKSALIHPVPLPIICCLLFAQTGMDLPVVVDKPMRLLGNAFGPISLVLAGVTLWRTPLQGPWRLAMRFKASKNLLLPMLVGLSAWAFGITGLPLTVIAVTAALPTGVNVFLLAHRYEVGQAADQRRHGLSTMLALVTLSLVKLLMSLLSVAS